MTLTKELGPLDRQANGRGLYYQPTFFKVKLLEQAQGSLLLHAGLE
jgi:hypothetical protein